MPRIEPRGLKAIATLVAFVSIVTMLGVAAVRTETPQQRPVASNARAVQPLTAPPSFSHLHSAVDTIEADLKLHLNRLLARLKDAGFRRGRLALAKRMTISDLQVRQFQTPDDDAGHCGRGPPGGVMTSLDGSNC